MHDNILRPPTGFNERQYDKVDWRLRARHRVEYALGIPLVALIRRLPESVATRLGIYVARLAYYLVPFRRKLGEANLAIAFPELPARERRHILLRSFENLGRTTIEIVRFETVGMEKLRSRVGYTEGSLANLKRALARGKGVIFATGHIGNWELLALAHALHGYPMQVVVRPLNNPLFDRALNAVRVRGRNQILERRKGVGEMINHLNGGGMTGLLVDHCPRRQFGIFVPFFDRTSLCHRGPALLALRTRAAVLPAFLRRSAGDGRFEIHVGPEIEVERTGSTREDVRRLTARIQKEMETEIRSRPEEWLWLHRRWKRGPPGENQYPSVVDKRARRRQHSEE